MTTQDFEQAKIILDDVEQAIIQSIKKRKIYILGDCLKKHEFKNSKLITGYFTNGKFEINFNVINNLCLFLVNVSMDTYKLVNNIYDKLPKTEYSAKFEQNLILLQEYLND